MRFKILVMLFITAGMSQIIPVRTMACPVPVYRYALEFWEADPYRLEIFFRNSLDTAEQAMVDYLIDVYEGNESKGNLMIRTVDIESDDFDISKSVLNERNRVDAPLMVLRYPFVSGVNSVVWSASLSRENIDLLLHSPVRESIADKLLSDATAVWIFLEGGNRRKDRDAMDLLETELAHLEQTLVLPDPELWMDNYDGAQSEKNPRIRFDILRLSRDDPREKFLINMLTNSEEGNDADVTEPMVFPVFGRGIILWAMAGEGINEDLITEAARFITGRCSCQAKNLNPGLDMLITKDWNAFVESIADMSVVNPLTGMGDFANREEEVRRQLESAVMERLGNYGTAGNRRSKEETGELVSFDVLGKDRPMVAEENTRTEGIPELRGLILLVSGIILGIGLVGGLLAYLLRTR
jgi:hypothetical protein